MTITCFQGQIIFPEVTEPSLNWIIISVLTMVLFKNGKSLTGDKLVSKDFPTGGRGGVTLLLTTGVQT